MLGVKDVTGQRSFTAEEFSRLHFNAGPYGSTQDLVVVAQLGTRLPDWLLNPSGLGSYQTSGAGGPATPRLHGPARPWSDAARTKPAGEQAWKTG